MTRLVVRNGDNWWSVQARSRDRRQRRADYEAWIHAWLFPLLSATEIMLREAGHGTALTMSKSVDAPVVRLELRPRSAGPNEPAMFFEVSMGAQLRTVAICRTTRDQTIDRAGLDGIQRLWSSPQGQTGDVLIAFIRETLRSRPSR